GLMPAMTNAQVIRAAEMLEPYEPPLAQAAIDALVERHADYSVDRLRACLREAAARLRDPQADRVADERAKLEKIGDDDRLFAGIDPRDMGTHVAAVIEQQTALNPIVGKRLAERPDPHANAF